ncbi:rubrerythrin family protein [Hathewaya limosa]|uniref:Rubrerythrin n=1 Tax=Hathewaya limosa TaxID=1536 RepID=A0ABU0JS69_HATLI|nr:rubrerythrin family protein [Hathewaya limosa]AWZ47807.1 rubrerythrin family protein [Clostridiaceae bacterium 14S0207]MDQ0479941.1 rubrerythrin [Hathewaya limosa]
MKCLKGTKTEKNLYKTFTGESRARNKYTFYEEKARCEGNQYVAEIFAETADNEKAHAREVFCRYLGLLGDSKSNLRDAIMGEMMENKEIYRQFEEEAKKEGFPEIADFFKELREVEENHAKRYATILKRLDNGTLYKRDKIVKWQCMNCGYIYEGKEAPEKCPLCKYPRGYFKIYCEDYK